MRPDPDLALCVQRFDDDGFARDLEATRRALVADGFEVWTEHLGALGAVLLCYVDRERRRPLEPDAHEAAAVARAAVRRALRTLTALRSEGLGAEVASACAVGAAVDETRGLADEGLVIALGELHRIRRSFVRGRARRHAALVEGVLVALARRCERPVG